MGRRLRERSKKKNYSPKYSIEGGLFSPTPLQTLTQKGKGGERSSKMPDVRRKMSDADNEYNSESKSHERSAFMECLGESLLMKILLTFLLATPSKSHPASRSFGAAHLVWAHGKIPHLRSRGVMLVMHEASICISVLAKKNSVSNDYHQC